MRWHLIVLKEWEGGDLVKKEIWCEFWGIGWLYHRGNPVLIVAIHGSFTTRLFASI